MRGIFFCVGQKIDDRTSGIGKKINSQVSALRRSSFKVELINVSNESSLLDQLFFWAPFINTPYKKRQISAIKSIDFANIDFLYIRKPTATSALISILKYAKQRNPKIKTIMELPTYPSKEYVGVKKILNVYSEIMRPIYRKYVDRILTYSKDESVWGIEAIPTTNCVDCSEIREKRVRQDENGEINIIAVADFNYWHGYDRMIKGLIAYYKAEPTVKIHLYLVGGGPVIEQYKKLALDKQVNGYVHFCGKLYGEELSKVFDICEIGLDAMGRHRSGVKYNSSLKGKEYGARGLPIISGVSTELDYDQSYKYYMRIPDDDSPVDMMKVLNFYKSIYYSGETREAIIRNIRKYTEDHFDYKCGYSAVINYIKDIKETQIASASWTPAQ